MYLIGTTLKRAVGILAATIGIIVLALPAGSSHAAGFAVAPVQAGPFAARVVQGPDAGEILAGTLFLHVSGKNQLSGNLVVHPGAGVAATLPGAVQGAALPQSRSGSAAAVTATHVRYMTVQWAVPVRGEVNPATHTVALSFALGGGRTFQTAFSPNGSQVSVQTAGPQQGDVASIFIHIHIEGDGWSIDIFIGKI